MDVLSLAGQPVPPEGAWLRVTADGPRRGGELTALVLPGTGPWPAAAASPRGSARTPARERRGRWRRSGWYGGVACPCRGLEHGQPAVLARGHPYAVVFADGALRELQDHGADIGTREEVGVLAAAGSVPTAFPSLPVQVTPRIVARVTAAAV